MHSVLGEFESSNGMIGWGLSIDPDSQDSCSYVHYSPDGVDGEESMPLSRVNGWNQGVPLFEAIGVESCQAVAPIAKLCACEKVDASVIQRFLEKEYGLNGIIRVDLINSGDNDIYSVTTASDRYVFRVSRPNKFWLTEPDHHLFEVEWLNFLKERGLPVSFPIARTDGRYLSVVETDKGRQHLALFSFAPGEEQLSPELAEILGRSIAQIHVASDAFRSQYHRHQVDLQFLLYDSLTRLENLLAGSHSEDLAYLREIATELDRRLQGLNLSGDAWGVIGGDFHGGNHHFTIDNEITHFDFDMCAYGWRAYDIAVFRWSGGSENDGRWEGFLKGYRSIRPLSDGELQAIPLFVLARQLWLMGFYAQHPEASEMLQADWDEVMVEFRSMVSAVS